MRNFKPFTELFDILSAMKTFNNWDDMRLQLNLLVEDKNGATLLFKNIMHDSDPKPPIGNSNSSSRITALEQLLFSRINRVLKFWERSEPAPPSTFSPLWHREDLTEWAISTPKDEDPKFASNKIVFEGHGICLEVK